MTYKLIEEFKKVVGKDSVFSVRAAISPLFLVVTWNDTSHPLHIFCITKGRDTYMAVNEKEYIAIATDRFQDYFNGAVSIQDLKNEYDVFEAHSRELYERMMNTDLSKLSDKELQSYTYNINALFVELVRKTIYIENVDYEKILSVIGLAHKVELDFVWERATEAFFISFEGRRLKKLLDLISSGKGDVVRQAKFIFTDYFWTKKESEIISEIEAIKEHFDERQREYEQILLTIKSKETEYIQWLSTLDSTARKIAEYAQLVMLMRDERKDPIAQIQAMCAEVSIAMLGRARVDIKSAPYVLLYEYMRGIDYLLVNKENIERRADGCIYMANPDLSYETENCDFASAVSQFEEMLGHTVLKNDELKGQIACRGNVQGIVRVVFDPRDDRGFRQGDVLVTSMTRPEFVPLMKRAGAVVTNEGGITCHAAIVSRELNIPCIIGTKIATQVLKDGDLVEVDADNGIVRKI
mgnify:CR=1 FL=1